MIMPELLRPLRQRTPTPTGRADRLDALRGFAVVWMAVFHFCYDLNHFRLLSPRQFFLSDPFWTGQRTAIVSLFLVCAGVGQAMALTAGLTWPRFWRRWAQIATCALLVSLGSAWMFPGSWISFGVLHGMAVMLLITRSLLPNLIQRGDAWAWLLVGSALCIAAPRLWSSAWLDTRWGNWTGLVTRLPRTEDYVPVLPWLGVMGLGVALGLLMLQHRPLWLSGPLPRFGRALLGPLAVLGRWSLSFYMLHQPVFIGGILAWLHFFGR